MLLPLMKTYHKKHLVMGGNISKKMTVQQLLLNKMEYYHATALISLKKESFFLIYYKDVSIYNLQKIMITN